MTRAQELRQRRKERMKLMDATKALLPKFLDDAASEEMFAKLENLNIPRKKEAELRREAQRLQDARTEYANSLLQLLIDMAQVLKNDQKHEQNAMKDYENLVLVTRAEETYEWICNLLEYPTKGNSGKKVYLHPECSPMLDKGQRVIGIGENAENRLITNRRWYDSVMIAVAEMFDREVGFTVFQTFEVAVDTGKLTCNELMVEIDL